MRYLLVGASGFLGTALRVRLAGQGHEVVRLVRHEPATATEFGWDPERHLIDTAAFEGVDAVVNLGGVNVFNRPWTSARRQAILASRTGPTGLLAAALADRARAGSAPMLIQASGIARYGTVRSGVPHTEDSPAAEDFLAQVTVQWEAATEEARAAGVRVVLARTSPVMDRSGGAFVPLRLAASLGLGATLGDGRQRMPMITLEDYLRFVEWATNGDHAGPYNLTLPVPCTNAEFTDTLSRALRRPRFLKAPRFALSTPLGEQADQLVGDMFVVPPRLLEHGFTFTAPDVGACVRSALAGAAASS